MLASACPTNRWPLPLTATRWRLPARWPPPPTANRCPPTANRHNPQVSSSMGGMGPLVLVTRVTNALTLTDPLTLRSTTLDASLVWRQGERGWLGVAGWGCGCHLIDSDIAALFWTATHVRRAERHCQQPAADRIHRSGHRAGAGWRWGQYRRRQQPLCAGRGTGGWDMWWRPASPPPYALLHVCIPLADTPPDVYAC